MDKTEKNRKKITQLKWPKYQKPKDKNKGWTKHSWQKLFYFNLFSSPKEKQKNNVGIWKMTPVVIWNNKYPKDTFQLLFLYFTQAVDTTKIYSM